MDGAKEILVYVNNYCLCGLNRCRFDIFKKNLTTNSISIFFQGPIIQEDIKILYDSTHGHHDILFLRRVYQDEQKKILQFWDGALWKWNGFTYDLYKTYNTD